MSNEIEKSKSYQQASPGNGSAVKASKTFQKSSSANAEEKMAKKFKATGKSIDSSLGSKGVYDAVNNIWVSSQTSVPQSGATWASGSEEASSKVAWGWLVLVGLILMVFLGGGYVYLQQAKKHVKVEVADEKTKKASNVEKLVTIEEKSDDMKLQSKFEAITGNYLKAKSVDEMMPFVRDAERVRPLMEKYYETHPFVNEEFFGMMLVMPANLESINQYFVTNIMTVAKTRMDIYFEVKDPANPKLDWEATTVYQPLDWNDFVKNKPAGDALDFRVNVKRDNFFSHEFSNSDEWICFLLSAPGADVESYLYGYVKIGSPAELKIRDFIEKKQITTSQNWTLKLSFLEGGTAPRGVIIEDLVSTSWINEKSSK